MFIRVKRSQIGSPKSRLYKLERDYILEFEVINEKDKREALLELRILLIQLSNEILSKPVKIIFANQISFENAKKYLNNLNEDFSENHKYVINKIKQNLESGKMIFSLGKIEKASLKPLSRPT